MTEVPTGAMLTHERQLTPGAVRKWCKRHGITSYIEQGKVMYRAKDIEH